MRAPFILLLLFCLTSRYAGMIPDGYAQNELGSIQTDHTSFRDILPSVITDPNAIHHLPDFEGFGLLQQFKKDTIPFFFQLLKVGDTLMTNGKYAEAGLWYRHALPYFVALNRRNLSRVYAKIGIALVKAQDKETAVKYYLKALKYIDQDKDPAVLQAKLYTNIAGILVQLQDYNKALSYLQKALPVFICTHDSLNTAINLATKARMWGEQMAYKKAVRDYDSALHFVNSLLLNEQQHTEALSLLTQITFNTASMYVKLKNPDSAIYYLGFTNPYRRLLTLYEQANYLAIYGHALAQKRVYKKAVQYLLQSLHIAESADFKDLIVPAHGILGNIYYEQHDYKKALEHGYQYINLQYYLFQQSKQNIHAINRLESKYQLSLRDNELMQKQLLITGQEKDLAQKNLWIGMTGLAALALAIIAGMLYRNYHRKQKLLLQQKEIEQLKATMQGEEKERGRIAQELHDGIVSQLMAVKLRFSSLLQQEAPIDREVFRQGCDYLDSTMQDLRKTTHNLMPESVLQSSLIGAIEDFCRQMDDENTTRIHFLTNGNYLPIDKSQELSLYRIVQELVQNALKYATARQLIVQLNYFDTLLEVTVEDDGKGFDVKATANGGSGLGHISERVKMLNGQLEITSAPGQGTSIYLEIPIIVPSLNKAPWQSK